MSDEPNKIPPPVAVALSDRQLMPPPPPRLGKRKADIVLEEDDYTAKIEAIIERDYFPELGKLQDKVKWLEAVRSGDPEQMRQAQVAIAQRRAAGNQLGITPGRPLFTPGGTVARAGAGPTPRATFLTPAVHGGETGRLGGDDDDGDGAADEINAQRIQVPNESLDSFLAKHTSEDNASFSEILETDNKRRRAKAEVLLQAAGAGTQRMLLTDGAEKTQGFGTSGQQPDTLLGWKYEPKNMLMYNGSTRDSLPYSKKELATIAEGPPKAISTRNTRFRPPPGIEGETPSTSGDTDTISGTTSGSTICGGGSVRHHHMHNTRAGATTAGGKPPRQGAGYDILATPSFDPGVDASPFITWGDIEATPMRIEAEDLPAGGSVRGVGGGGNFSMKAATARETYAHRMAGKAANSLKKRTSTRLGGGSTPSIAGTPLVSGSGGRFTGSVRGTAAAAGTTPSHRHSHHQRGGGGVSKRPVLSEAAKRLAGNLQKGQKKSGGIEADTTLRASYRGGGGTPARRSDATPALHDGGWTPAGH